MSETPLLRDGKVILRRVDNDDGSITLKKPLPLKLEHIMQQTGAPGWDKRYVDQTFSGKDGTLEYIYGISKFSINSRLFLAHAYVTTHAVYGEQYHCEKKWYAEDVLVVTSPLREERPFAPARLEFGTILNCTRCKGTGAEPGFKSTDKHPCTACKGVGVVPWKPSQA